MERKVCDNDDNGKTRILLNVITAIGTLSRLLLGSNSHELLPGNNRGIARLRYIPTKPNIAAATTAIIDPLPVPISDER